MSKITLERIKGKNTIVNRLSYPESINERVYTAIASGMFEGCLPLAVSQKRKELRLECMVQGLAPLSYYFGGIVTKRMFLDFVHELAQVIKNCEKNMISPNNLDLEREKIFVDLQTKKIKCIYWPVVNGQNARPPHFFLQQLPSQLCFDMNEDTSYLNEYLAFFGGVEPFSINSFDKMVLRLAGKNVSGHITPSEALARGNSGRSVPEKNEETRGDRNSVEYDPFADQSGQKDGGTTGVGIPEKVDVAICFSCGQKNTFESKFCIHCGTKIKIEVSAINEEEENISKEYETVVLGEDSGGTTVLGYDEEEEEEVIIPQLLRLKTEESFPVDKAVFRIGAIANLCDLCISDNTYISRNHADIITREERYYIVDQKSTNKTYVDGKMIPPETEVEIFPGTQIRLANEDFVFNIES